MYLQDLYTDLATSTSTHLLFNAFARKEININLKEKKNKKGYEIGIIAKVITKN